MKNKKHGSDYFTILGLIGFVVILSILYSALSILRHMHFQSGGFDLGLYDQTVWKFSQFLDPFNTVKGRIIFGDHLVLTLPLLGPLLYLWNDVRILLIAQAVAIALSSVPIYYVALKRLGYRIGAWTVTILYSLFFGIQYGVYFDMHPIIFGVALLSVLMYCVEYNKKKAFWIFLVLSLLTQENMGIAVAGVGIMYLFRREYRKTGLFLILSGISYTLIALKVVTFFSPIGYEYKAVIAANPIAILTQLFDSEEKRLTWLYSYSWFSFLPLFSPGSVIATTMDLSQYFVTGQAYARMWSPFMHHRAILSIFLTIGFIDTLAYVSSWKRIRTGICLLTLFVACFCQFQFHFALNKLSKRDYWKEEAWMDNTRKLLAFVPVNRSVATQQNLVPYLSHRREIYLIYPRQHDIESRPCGQKLCWWLDYAGKPDYLVVDTRPNQWLTQILESNANWISAIENMEKTGTIRLEQAVGDCRLYRINP
jgi:uncharacterized membrane protein